MKGDMMSKIKYMAWPPKRKKMSVEEALADNEQIQHMFLNTAYGLDLAFISNRRYFKVIELNGIPLDKDNVEKVVQEQTGLTLMKIIMLLC